MKCEGCNSTLVHAISRRTINRADNLNEIDKLLVSNLFDSERYYRMHILDLIRGSHGRHGRHSRHEPYTQSYTTEHDTLQQRMRRNRIRLTHTTNTNNQSAV